MAGLERVGAIGLALSLIVGTACNSKTPTEPGPGPNNPGATCRTYPTTTSVATTSQGVTLNAQLTGAFDTTTKKATVTNSFVGGLGLCSTTVTNYNSVADFVDEVGVIPGVSLAVSNTTTNAAVCGGTTVSTTLTYDSQRRIVKFSNTGGSTTYTAWDSYGRPTQGSSSSGMTIAIVYDNAARTWTSTQTSPGGAKSVGVLTFDAAGEQISNVVTDASGTSTTIYTNTATATVCK